MPQAYEPSDFYCAGTITAKNNIPSPATVGDTQVIAGAGVAATKLQQQYECRYDQPVASTVVADGRMVHQVYGAVANLVAFQALVVTPPVGAMTISVDLQKSTGGGAFATILSAPISITSATAARTAVTAAIANAGLIAGDVLQVVVTVAGASGTQGLGLLAAAIIRELPQ